MLAKSFARIHWQNLANFGVLALEFVNPDDYDTIREGDVLVLDGLRDALTTGSELSVHVPSRDAEIPVRHRLSPRQLEDVLAGGIIPKLALRGR